MATGRKKGTMIAFWVLRVVVGLAFLAAGGSKLAGAPAMVVMFAKIGFGQWFRILTGLLEVTAAIGYLFLATPSMQERLCVSHLRKYAVCRARRHYRVERLDDYKVRWSPLGKPHAWNRIFVSRNANRYGSERLG